jgi:membrane protein
VRVARRFAVAAYRNQLFFLASALAFNALLAALPFALLLLAALGYFVHPGTEAMHDVQQYLARLLPSSPSGTAAPVRRAEEIILSIVESRGQLSWFGFPLFLWFATRLFTSVRIALNRIFHTHESRAWLAGVAVDLELVFVTLILLVANVAVAVWFGGGRWFDRFVVTVSSYGLGVALFFIVYTVAPIRAMRADTTLLAAAVASLGFEVARKLFGLYLVQFATIDRLISNANAIAVILFVVWIYAMACIFLLGAEVAETYDVMRRGRVGGPTDRRVLPENGQPNGAAESRPTAVPTGRTLGPPDRRSAGPPSGGADG